MSLVRLSGVVEESIVDGPGFRFVVFTQGCPHHCPGCQNPQTHDFDGGYMQEMDELLDKMKHDPLLKGVTLSGGEPFEQAEELLDFVKKVRESGYDVFAYSGYTYEQLIAGSQKRPAWLELLKMCDVLVDGRFELEKKSLDLLFRGSSNQRLIDVKKSLAAGQAVIADI